MTTAALRATVSQNALLAALDVRFDGPIKVQDLVTAADVPAVTFPLAAPDSVGAGDTVVVAATYARSVSETVTITDGVSGVPIAVNETTGTADQPLLQYDMAVADTATSSDSATKTISPVLADSATGSESAVKAPAPTYADSAATSDTCTPGDLYFNKTSLLLHGNGTNGSTTITDSSSNAVTVTASGNAQISTAQSKFGGASIAFDGSSDYLLVSNNALFGFGTDDYTIEFFLYLTSLPGSKYTLMDFRATSGATPHTVYVNSSGYLGYFNGSSDVTVGSGPLSTGTWYHCAWSRQSGTLRIFVDGAQVYSAAHSTDYQASRPITIGAAVSGIEGLNGYMDEVRITKGVARYTSAFTAPTAQFLDF